MGLLVLRYGVFMLPGTGGVKCSSDNKYKMCPLCDEEIGCKYWKMSDVLGEAKDAYLFLFDHLGTSFTPFLYCCYLARLSLL